MTNTDMLTSLKTDLGITTTSYDTRLTQLLQIAAAEIIKEGASTLNTLSSAADANLCIMYAAWMWRRRDSMDGMPRMLRWQLNNRIFSEKMEG